MAARKLHNIADWQIQLGLDYGTSKCVMAYVLCENGKPVDRVSPITIRGGEHEIPSIATWENDRLLHGFELRALATEDTTIGDKIMSRFKLALYKSPETTEITKGINELLAELPGQKTLDMLISDHIKALVETAKAALRDSTEQIRFHPDDLEQLLQRLLVRLTVPQMWTPAARRQMQSAAKEAGLSLVVLSSEPQAALAYLVHHEASRLSPLKKNSEVLVADLGAGTGDFVTYKLLDNLDTNSRLRLVAHSNGGLCGSSKVDDYLWETILKRETRAWRIKTCTDLKVTDRDFRRRALTTIETMKIQVEDKVQHYTETIRGIGREIGILRLSRQEIYAAFDKVIVDVMQEIETQAKESKQWPDVMMITGGFAKSSYLMTKLKEKYECLGIRVVRPNDTDRGNCYPVAVGALLRFDNIETQSLPSQYGFAMLQREEYDPDVHTDAHSICDETGEVTEDPMVVKDSPYESDVAVVDDRLVVIMQKGEMLGTNQAKTVNIPLEFFVPVSDNPCLSGEFVYMTRAASDHDPAKRPVRQDGKDDEVFRGGIFPWATVDIPLEEKKLIEYGFPTITTADGEEHWEIDARVVITNRGHDIQLGFQIMQPKDSDGDINMGTRKRFKKPKMAFQVDEKLWDGAHSEFMQN